MGARPKASARATRRSDCVTVGVRQKAPAAPSPNKAASTRPAFGPAATQKPATRSASSSVNRDGRRDGMSEATDAPSPSRISRPQTRRPPSAASPTNCVA